jgi:murein DD-endopeptidase MepM/ murein hydrolase activator NlpD
LHCAALPSTKQLVDADEETLIADDEHASEPEPEQPEPEVAQKPPKNLRAVFAGAFVVAALGVLFKALSHPSPSEGPRRAEPRDASAVVVASPEPVDTPEVPHDPVFRIATLKSDPKLEWLEGAVGKRTFTAALAKLGIGTGEAARVIKAFEGVRSFDRCHPKDQVYVVRERDSRRIVGLEYEVSPLEIFQARAPESDSALVGKKLQLFVTKKRVSASVVVGEDLKATFSSVGLDPDIVKRLDDALDGHLSIADIHPGGRMRVIAEAASVEGVFARYDPVLAVEYFPPSKHAPALRVYAFLEGGKMWHHYDARGQKPFHGGWRVPIPFARITSRFNPHRMHPVLHKVMPHNGVDYAGVTGTPVYAVAPGTLRVAGDSGPCGNMVQISHAGGLTSAYCHLSKFAAGLHVGEKVESRQLLGYVGQTGRVTGPHLHFAVKKNNQFIDPAILKMGAVLGIAKSDHDAFQTKRKALDAALDALPLAEAEAPDEAADGGLRGEASEAEFFDENFDEEDEKHDKK